jgi:nucleotide-binding universal stress UspA family protein
MTTNKILVGTDTTASADLAVRDAARLARERGAELLVLYVAPEDGLQTAVDPAKAASPETYLSAMTHRFEDVRTSTRIETGDPAELICRVAADEGADTIVVGNRGVHGSRWRLRESVPNDVLRHSPCSVLVVDTRRAQ